MDKQEENVLIISSGGKGVGLKKLMLLPELLLTPFLT